MKVTKTQRLFIDEATIEESSFFFRLLNSPGWLTHVGDRNIKSEKEAENYIADKIIKSYAVNGFGLYVMRLKESNAPIGICGFVKRDYLPHADLGFALLPGYEGSGYMREAAQSLMEYGFMNVSFSELLAVASFTNDKSKRLLTTLGFEDAGIVQPDDTQPAAQLFRKKRLNDYKPLLTSP